MKVKRRRRKGKRKGKQKRGRRKGGGRRKKMTQSRYLSINFIDLLVIIEKYLSTNLGCL